MPWLKRENQLPAGKGGLPKMPIKLFRGVIGGMITILIVGCSVGPDYTKPNIPVPNRWSTRELPSKAGHAGDVQSWWTAFNDPVLTQLIEMATKGNLDVRQAIARIDESRALVQAATGRHFPELGASGSVLRGKLSENAIGISVPGGMSIETVTETTYSIGMSSAWEIDLFGRIRRTVEAASANYQASIEDFHSVLVALTAQVAAAYIDYREYQHRLVLARERLNDIEKLRDLVAKRVEAGIASKVELSDVESKVAETKAQLPMLQNGLVVSRNRLCALLGLPPGSIDDVLREVRSIPAPPQEVLVSIPTEVVRQRPDIRKAERRLAAQTAMIGVRVADLYPRFSLLGSFSFSSLSVSTLLESASLGFNFGPTLTWNIFKGGVVRAQIKAEEARTRQALAAYENTLITAFKEVENAISTFRKSADQLESIKELVRERKRSLSLAEQLYKSGKQDYLSVLTARLAVCAAEEQQLMQEARIIQSLVMLYRALGGGWSNNSLTTVLAEIQKEQALIESGRNK
jgi:NodT family efflux transporter outer membrane factor (OMF) lipoprotein